jgi:hypothetical protein
MQHEYGIVPLLFKSSFERITIYVLVTEQFFEGGNMELLHIMIFQDHRNGWHFWIRTHELGALELIEE